MLNCHPYLLTQSFLSYSSFMCVLGGYIRTKYVLGNLPQGLEVVLYFLSEYLAIGKIVYTIYLSLTRQEGV